MYDGNMLEEGAQLFVTCIFKFHATQCVVNWRAKHLGYNELFEKMWWFFPF